MRVSVVVLVVPNLTEVTNQGLRHPILGRLFDGGSYAQIHDLPIGVSAVQQMFAFAQERATKAGVAIRHVNDLDAIDEDDECIQLLHHYVHLHNAVQSEQSWYQEVARGAVLSLIIVDEQEQHSSLVLLYNYILPCMGPIAPCSLEDVWHSWLRIAHGTPTSGCFLLEEPESSADALAEADLTERLRLLYGE